MQEVPCGSGEQLPKILLADLNAVVGDSPLSPNPAVPSKGEVSLGFRHPLLVRREVSSPLIFQIMPHHSAVEHVNEEARRKKGR